MTNKAIARVLKETAALIELTGGNPFRSRAFSGAARTIERIEDPIAELIAAQTLTDIKGIGSGLQDQISELLDRGSFALRDDLLGAIPPGLMDILAVKGLGAKKVRTLWQTLSIQTLEDLEGAALTGRIAELDGFGARSQKSILENVAAVRAYRKKRHYADARTRVDSLLESLASLAGVRQAVCVGELARKMETVSRAEILLKCDPIPNVEILESVTGKLEADPEMNSTWNTRLNDGLPLRLVATVTARFGRVQFELSSGEEFLSEWNRRFGPTADAAMESEIFERAGLDFIAPELRDSVRYLESPCHVRMDDLITTEDLRGSLHNHSRYSDGAHSLREMAEAARGMGLSYFGICDHSQSLKIANGMPVSRVRQQHEEIRKLNLEYAADKDEPFRIFAGIESDILAYGALDYNEDVLESFDFIVASIHTGFNMTEAEATERIVTAVSNPYTSILGHPTGRLLLRREGYPVNHEAILQACASYGVSIELNANPYRLDLDWRWIARALELGILISINPDAHSIEQLAYVRWGVEVARKGAMTKAGCLNAMSLDDFETWIMRRSI